MLSRTWLALALVALPLTSPAPLATDGAQLEGAMKTLQAGQQRLGKSIDKKDFAASLGTVAEMEAAAHTAKLETPPKAAEIKDAAPKAEFMNGFKKQMIELERALLDLEVTLIDGKGDEAKKIFDERIKAIKKDAHAKYKGD